MGWHEELLIGFDLETTGTDPESARIVTAALTEVRGGELAGAQHWLIDPGVPIPAETTTIHGITTEWARAKGQPAAVAVEEIAAALAGHWAAGTPVVAFNAVFDLSLLAAELRRHGLPSLGERVGGEVGPVVDPLTVDRAVDRYRKGKRTLEAACAFYGVELDGAHEASADALAAVRVAVAIATRHPEVAAQQPWALHRTQIGWHADWAADFQRWLRRGRDPLAVVDGRWPLREPQPMADSA
ncbi:DNA polymerase III subunit epsilon [Wenjunlia vitaminophila]|uniref:DNA polymerase III subunit epsilon n=1 Tax=Wenjunlia vitaminophila TaxID=76728 RepID=A0A0T6LZH7_WENVI|nr:exonuclease domain-containing protein [Wenjunlia vitaminophila]KRV51360.1 DNA polymerase III subunit epsilon [Wenjunlia vitaminophila]